MSGPVPEPAGGPAPFRYSLFGFAIASELPLPELLPDSAAGPPDVTVRLGPVAAEDGPGVTEFDGGIRLQIDGVARFWVGGGRDILVDPEPGVPEQNVRLYLLGSVAGILIHQRGLLPLHANAVEVGGSAVAFMGASGEGKSTLAAWFHDRGHRVIADDVCAIRFDGQGRPLVHPGIPRLRLWRDSLEAFGRDALAYQRSYRGAEDWEKYDVPIPSGEGGPLPLAAVYLLGRGETLAIRRLGGLDSAEALFAHTYRGAMLSFTRNPRAHWEACLQLVRNAPVFAADRPRDLAAIGEESLLILNHAEEVVRSNPDTPSRSS